MPHCVEEVQEVKNDSERSHSKVMNDGRLQQDLQIDFLLVSVLLLLQLLHQAVDSYRGDQGDRQTFVEIIQQLHDDPGVMLQNYILKVNLVELSFKSLKGEFLRLSPLFLELKAVWV